MTDEKGATPPEGDATDTNINTGTSGADGYQFSSNGFHDARGGYARAYTLYDERGWPNSLWLPSETKFPPPDRDEINAKIKFTGNGAKSPSVALKAKWAQQNPHGNIAQRAPSSVLVDGQEWDLVGLDVDHYGAKRGVTRWPRPRGAGVRSR